jgi:hypothetical protein
MGGEIGAKENLGQQETASRSERVLPLANDGSHLQPMLGEYALQDDEATFGRAVTGDLLEASWGDHLQGYP